MAFKIEVSASFNIKELRDKDRAMDQTSISSQQGLSSHLSTSAQLTSGFLKSTHQPQHMSIVPGFLSSVPLRISSSQASLLPQVQLLYLP